MSNSIDLMKYIFNKTLDFLFNQMTFQYLSYSVSIGWFITGLVVFGILIGSFLNIPRSLNSNAYFSGQELERSYYNTKRHRFRGGGF